MTRRQDLEHHRKSLGEIREIMNSMKTLAYMETRKLTRFLDAQLAVVQSIEGVAADFLAFHADTLPAIAETTPVYLLIGTERGFCGDFNQALVRHLESIPDMQPGGSAILIAVGYKLHALLHNDARVAAFIKGVSVVEEVTDVLNQIVNELSTLQKRHPMMTVHGIFRRGDGEIAVQKLLPPFQSGLPQSKQPLHPPLIQLSPEAFLLGLTEQYLYASLHTILYESFMTENHNRVTHLEGAVKYLDDESEDLARRCRSLRQEEIIEEIEIILLSTGGLDGDRRHQRP